jgi:putative transcriptional regulator
VEKREKLVEDLRKALMRAGFFITEKQVTSSIFDLIAKREKVLLLIKALFNVDSLKLENAMEIRYLAEILEALPFVVGEVCNSCALEDGVIYLRHGVPATTKRTFIEYVKEESQPLIYAAPGGLYARMDGRTLRRIREERSISISTIAGVAGVSRKAITMYENGLMGASVGVVAKIEEFLNIPLTLPVDVEELAKKVESNFFTSDSLVGKFETEIFSLLESFGYDVSPFKHCPFDAVVSKGKSILSEVEKREMEIKAQALASISEVVEKESAIFVKKRKKDHFKGIAVISEEEVKKSPEDLFELIEKKKRRI